MTKQEHDEYKDRLSGMDNEMLLVELRDLVWYLSKENKLDWHLTINDDKTKYFMMLKELESRLGITNKNQ